MNALKLAGAAALLTLSVTGTYAADLMKTTAPSAAIAEPVLSGFYAQIYGGAALAGTDDFVSGSSDLNLGWAAGGALGWETGIDGLAVELDVLHTHRDVAGSKGDTADTNSVMVDAKYAFHLTDSFDIYAGAGLGGVNLNYFSGTDHSGWGLGYQVMVGAGLNLTDTVSAFAEYRYQNTFNGVGLTFSSSTFTDHVPTSLLLAGLKFKF